MRTENGSVLWTLFAKSLSRRRPTSTSGWPKVLSVSRLRLQQLQLLVLCELSVLRHVAVAAGTYLTFRLRTSPAVNIGHEYDKQGGQ